MVSLVQLGRCQGLWIRVLSGGLAYLPGDGSSSPGFKAPEELLSLVMATQQKKADSIQSWRLAWLLEWGGQKTKQDLQPFLFTEF